MFTLYFDGASKGNPGNSGFGGVILDEEGKEVLQYAEFLSNKGTNNEAEYMGCLYGIQCALDKKIENLQIFGDSKLVVQQVTGKWKVKSENLQKYHEEIIKLIPKFKNISFHHVERKYNKIADGLANEGIKKEFFTN